MTKARWAAIQLQFETKLLERYKRPTALSEQLALELFYEVQRLRALPTPPRPQISREGTERL
jgi:hypothetical protein